MTQALVDKQLEDWANFDFEAANDFPKAPESETFQTELPDAFAEEEETVDQTTSGDIDEDVDELTDVASPPAYQGLEIPIAEVPMYKRPHMKAVFFGSGVLAVAMGLGFALTRGTGVQLGNKPSEAPQKIAPKSTEDSQEKLSELEGEVAFGTLKNRAAVLEEQKKQRILKEKLEKEKQANQNSVPLNSVPLNSVPNSVPRPVPRLPLSGIPTRVVPPVISSRSDPTPRLSQGPASRPVLPPSSIPSAPVQTALIPEAPTLLSFGAMPDSEVFSPAPSGGFTTVSNRGTPALAKPNELLAQQENAFLAGKRQTMIQGGQTIPAQITEQVLAASEATFIVRTTGSILGLPQGTELIAQVTQLAGDGRMTAEAIAISNSDGSQTAIPQGSVSITKSNGDLLRAKSSKGFFQSGLGKGLLGAGRGIAEQFTSRSESFSSNQFGSNFTRGAGSRDLSSLGSAALKGLADPLLDNPNNSESSLLLNPGQSVRLKVNRSFTVSL